MGWVQISVETDAGQAAGLEQALLEAGALSVTAVDAADQPLLEPGPGETPLWDRLRLIALFPADCTPELVRLRLQAQLGPESLPGWQVETLEDQEWTRSWMDHFQPMAFGRRLWIIPEGYTAPDPRAVNLRLDPGLAFGTGTHPTTALCLEWLDGAELAGTTVLDYGCGSGILAIAALLLGACEAWGVDNDPQALTASRDNAAKNQVAERLHTLLPQQLPTGEPGESALQVDVCLANILAGPLLELAPALAAHTRPGGHIVLSGILAQQADAVRSRYDKWFTMKPGVTREEWVRLEGVRRRDVPAQSV